MICLQTILKPTDNSGVRQLKCFYIFGKKFNDCAIAGDVIFGSVKKCILKKKLIKKGDKHRGVLVRTCRGVRRCDGNFIKFHDNAIVILGLGKDPFGTRVFGPVFREIRVLGYLKIVSLSSRLI